MRSLRLTAESFLPRGDSKVIFVVATAAYCAIISHFLSTFLRVFVSRTAEMASPFAVRHPVLHIFELLIFAPLFETLLLIGVIELLRKLGAPSLVRALAGAWLLSATHFLPTILHALIVLPGFCIMAGSYLYWRTKASWKSAYLVVVLTHSLLNLTPALPYIGYAMRQR